MIKLLIIMKLKNKKIEINFFIQLFSILAVDF